MNKSLCIDYKNLNMKRKHRTSGAESREHDRQWLLLQVNHIIEPMLLEIFSIQPENGVSKLFSHLSYRLHICYNTWKKILANEL